MQILAMTIETGAECKLARSEVPVDPVGPYEVAITVETAALNRADLSMINGSYRQAATQRTAMPLIAGLECAGTVTEVGPKVTRLQVGDRVMSMCGAAWASRVVVDSRIPLRIPGTLSWTEAACLPIALMTETDALLNAGRMEPGDTVLITAAGSAVGLVGAQLARLWGAHRVIGTALGQSQVEAIEKLAGIEVLDASNETHPHELFDALDPDGANVLIDHVGASELSNLLEVAALGSRIVSVGRLGGTVASLDMDTLARKRVSLVGVTFRTRSIQQYGEISRLVEEHSLEHVASGALRPVVAGTFPLSYASEALAAMARAEHVGKIVLINDLESRS